MRIIYPQEMKDMRKEISDEDWYHPEQASKETQEKIKEVMEKVEKYDEEWRKAVLGF